MSLPSLCDMCHLLGNLAPEGSTSALGTGVFIAMQQARPHREAAGGA